MRRLAALSIVVCAGFAGCASSMRRGLDIDELASRLPGENRADLSSRTSSEIAASAEQAFAERSIAGGTSAVSLWLEVARREPNRTDGWVGATRVGVWLADRTEKRRLTLPAADRVRWATTAVDAATLCTERRPDSIRCAYWLAIALGVQARERRATGLDALPRMVELLDRSRRSEPELDRGGPDRVLAWVFLAAPAWPTGPGDPDLAAEHARAACTISPDHPPNFLVLAAVLQELGQRERAREAFRQALEGARGFGSAAEPDRDDWIEEALSGLANLGPGEE